MRYGYITEEEWASMQSRVRGSTDARRTTAQSGSRRDPAIHKTTSRRGESAPSPPFTPFQLALTGQLPSGKNQVQLSWRNGKVHRYPNKTFVNWRANASVEILEQYSAGRTLTQPVCLTCNYWPGDHRTRDVSGQLDAIFSILVYARVLKNDGLVYSVWWRRHEVNAKFPKLVMELEAWHP